MRVGVAKEIKPQEYRVALTPAGARELVQRGHDVLVVDRATFPRDKVCGEGLMPHGVEELSLIHI